MEFVKDLWNSLPGLVHWFAYFWFSIIIVRGVIAKDITTWLEDKGFVQTGKKGWTYKALDFVYAVVLSFVDVAKRQAALWAHYRDHGHYKVLECGQDRCVVFSE